MKSRFSTVITLQDLRRKVARKAAVVPSKNCIEGSKINLNQKFRTANNDRIEEQCVDWKKNLS